MEGYEYLKVILYAYPHLEALAEAVEVGAENQALLSYRSREGTLIQLVRVAEEFALARALFDLSEQTEKVICRLGEEERYLLEYKYFRRDAELKRYSGELPYAERSYFRRQRALLRKLRARFASLGVTEKSFLDAFGGYTPFMRAYEKLCDGEEASVHPRTKVKQPRFVSTRELNHTRFVGR